MTESLRFSQINKKRRIESANRREQFLKIYRADPDQSVTSICRQIGMSMTTYTGWSTNHPEFRAAIEGIRAQRTPKKGKTPHFDNSVGKFEGTFVERRKHYFGFSTPWFQQETARAYARAKPGDVILTLMPPEHGKTAFTEDFLTDSIGQDKSRMITVVSEGKDMARKISRRIQTRLTLLGPTPKFVYDYGPFQPQLGEGGHRQAWSVDQWSVYGSDIYDTRDYTFAVGGWNSAIAGTRASHLHIDDLQSLKSLDLTEKMFDRFRQDMLSRPGETGITTINGTRVGDKDFYARVINEFRGEDFFQLVQYPAIVLDHVTQEPKPLWEYSAIDGAGYSMDQLERLRKKVGEEAWWRNYMQQPRTSSLIVFSDEGIEKSQNPHRSMNHNQDQVGVDNQECWITLDPSIGGVNVVAAMHPGKKLMLLDLQQDENLARNSDIAEVIRQVAQRCRVRGWRPTMLIIEAMAFQKGLIEDEWINDVAAEFGMRIESHMTGLNKYDENIGVPSMASSFENGDIDLPFQSEYDRAVTDSLTAQLRSWKPTRDRITGQLKFKRGTQLVQDKLMAFWFGWIWWASLRAEPKSDVNTSEAFRMGGLPYRPTGTGLLVPAGR